MASFFHKTPLQAFKRLHFQAHQQHHLGVLKNAITGLLLGVSDAVQRPSDADEGRHFRHRFRCASGPIPNVVQAPFKARNKAASGASPGALQRPIQTVLQALFSGIILTLLRPHISTISGPILTPFQASYQRRSGAIPAPFRCHTSAVQAPYQRRSSVIPGPYQRRSSAIPGAVQAPLATSLLGVVQAPFKARLSHHSNAV